MLAGVKPSVPGWGAKPEDYQPLMDATQVYFDSSDGKTGVTGDKVGRITMCLPRWRMAGRVLMMIADPNPRPLRNANSP